MGFLYVSRSLAFYPGEYEHPCNKVSRLAKLQFQSQIFIFLRKYLSLHRIQPKLTIKWNI